MIFSFDYMIFMLPAMILAGLATLFTKRTFNKYARSRVSSGMTGAQAAYRMLRSQGVDDVRIEQVNGFLSDHYDPSSRTLRLSPQVYQSPSLSAVGVACHEAGHALQHSQGYAALALRSALVPAFSIGTNAAWIFFMLGMFINSLAMMKMGAFLFTGVVAFSLVTLPVEWNATARAKQLMATAGIVSTPEEQQAAGSVLNAAFLTYVASAFTALMTLLYFLLRSGLLGGRDD